MDEEELERLRELLSDPVLQEMLFDKLKEAGKNFNRDEFNQMIESIRNALENIKPESISPDEGKLLEMLLNDLGQMDTIRDFTESEKAKEEQNAEEKEGEGEEGDEKEKEGEGQGANPAPLFDLKQLLQELLNQPAPVLGPITQITPEALKQAMPEAAHAIVFSEVGDDVRLNLNAPAQQTEKYNGIT